jgi:hypothetical protein
VEEEDFFVGNVVSSNRVDEEGRCLKEVDVAEVVLRYGAIGDVSSRMRPLSKNMITSLMYMISRGGVKDVINDSAMLWNESVSCS